MRGQATVAVVIALALGGGLALLAAEFARLAVERAHAQRVADSAALAAALAAPGDERRAAVAAASAGAAVVADLDLRAGTVAVQVRLRARTIDLGALLGRGWTSVAATARASAERVSDADAMPDWVPPRYAPALRDAARRESLPVAVLAAQLRVESGFDPGAVSVAGAQGIAQFMPATWNGAWNPWRAAGPFAPDAAIAAQARLLSLHLLRFQGDLDRALAAYNAGPGRVGGPPATWPAETRRYVPAIRALAAAATGAPTARLRR